MMNNNNNNNSRRNVVKEDAPIMRSVQIQSAVAPTPLMPGRSAMAPTTKIAPQKIARSVEKAWKVHDLRPLPSFYRLERTHLTIDDASAEKVSMRIADCLRQESVSATFNDDEVRCRDFIACECAEILNTT